MASARNEAPKALRRVECAEEVSPSPPREGCGEVAMPPPQTFFRFLTQTGKFWCILGANFIAVEL